MPIRIYDFKRVTANFGDIPLEEFGPDAAISIDPVEAEDQFAFGVDGVAVVSVSAVNAYVATVTVMSNSPVNRLLAEARRDQEDSGTPSSFSLDDALTGDSVSEQYAWLATRAPMVKGKSASPVEWRILLPDPEITIAANVE